MNVAVDVRIASASQLLDVGGLRWDSLLENGGSPDESRDVFSERFAEWGGAHTSTHTCFAAVASDGIVIGMAWLAITQRVPSARAFDRAFGDVQCVYVVPELRNSGIGARLVRAVLERAADLGLEPVTVHSSAGAVPFYRRAGFASEDVLLHVRA
ncbi:GNAT family N-acetyltransferase [Leifsonia sp. NCR5]|uniref:GNAT family N-acetyltransferase n=1 Tax=Leifsonia sp. NCR5 TaxID=1978342 RepID=UPI000A196ECE|nr:GNAT family N-acetyltransferase [Leifsonia sp. NCR5]